jgi:ankyrin repeat protein
MNPDAAAVAAAVATGKLHASASSQDDVWAAQLEAAVASGDVATTQRLLAEQPRGSDPADPDLLLFACEHGHAAVVECLVRDAGLTPSCASPLHLAAKNGHNAVVRALLEARCEP